MKKIYEVIFRDEYDNHYHCGFHDSLDESLDELNEYLKQYGNGKYVLKSGDIKEYQSTFGECFNVYLSQLFEDEFGDEAVEDLQSCMVLGFVYHCEDDVYEVARKVLF